MRLKKFFRILLFGMVLTTMLSCGAVKTGRDALRSHEIGEYYKAIDRYRKASRQEKDRSVQMQYAYAIAECYRNIGDYKRAAMYYLNAIRRGYQDPEALVNLAEMQRYTEEYDEAEKNYKLYLQEKPGDERALNGLKAIEMTQEWINNPTRHIINHIKEINSYGSDFSPVFVAGRDNEIIFTSMRPAATGRRESMITGQKYADLFRTTFNVQRQKWEQPELLEEDLIINTSDEEGTSTLSASGEQMIFTRCRYDNAEALG